MRKKTNKDQRVSASMMEGRDSSALSQQMNDMRRDGYTVFPASFSEGLHREISDLNILNFQGSARSFRHESSDPTASAGGYLTTGVAVPIDKDRNGNPLGTPGKGYIQWGPYNNLPNIVALVNSKLIYTALCVKFNIDVLCGLGVEPTYEYHSAVGCNENENLLSYKHAGDYLQSRIERMRSKMFNLLREHIATPAPGSAAPAPGSASPAPVPEGFPEGSVASSAPVVIPHSSVSSVFTLYSTASCSGSVAPVASAVSPVVHPSQRPIVPATVPEGSPEGPDDAPDDGQLDIATLHAPDGLGYKRYADGILDDMIRSYRANIKRMEKEYKTWARTNNKLQQFDKNHNQPSFAHDVATDLVQYNIAFVEVQLSQDATRQKDPALWRPTITGLRYRDALTCRLEEKDESGVSRYVYISNRWLLSADAQQKPEDMEIAALPALDPAAPLADLTDRVRRFRNDAASARDRLANFDAAHPELATSPATAPEALAEDPDAALLAERAQLAAAAAWYANPDNRPCRFILPIVYRTSGRFYYPQPASWSVYKDIYSYAANIIHDRAIRKQNETMFTYVLYVHQSYLNQLTNQVNAQKTEKEKAAIKAAEIKKIKDFLSNKQNNGSTLAACTFVGQDGKDHDAFRVERIDYANTKQNAEADKTEITDMASLISFAFECHPDLIGATPGVSSNGGTYQREMLLITQSKKANMQQMMLAPYNLIRDFNDLDTHLSYRIKQRVLTTLDASKTGIVDE